MPFLFWNRPMHLITWNLNKRKAIEPQIEVLTSRQPDVIALQEVSERNIPRLREAFGARGFIHHVDSHHTDPMPRRPFVMIVSRHPLHLMDTPNVMFPQAYVAAHVIADGFEFEVHNLHVPSFGAYSWEIKLDYAEGVYRHLARKSVLPRMVCGDFNSPMAELDDGTLITFAQVQRSDGRYDVVRGKERIDAAERNLLTGLAAYDLHDAFRRLHGNQRAAWSWGALNRGQVFGFRLDHILASSHFVPTACDYLYAWREANLSDHAAMEAVFAV